MILQGFAVLLFFQLLGELLVRASGLLVPGPVLGMALLLAFLLFRKGIAAPIRETSEGLLRYLPLLFVPAGVGLINHGVLLKQDFVVIAVTLVISTALTLAVTVLVLQGLKKLLGAKNA
ncbi:CidA/LrgA family protein [Marinospirillum sp.]|uniref:CidA/LrgA family protein n=1 Tax=Marinospirillum sp. TaxID=2183934 RepID=UPI00384E844E